MEIQHFYLNRLIDESGMSGLGKVAEGVVLPNGMAIMWWLKPPYSVQQYHSIDDLSWIHGHGKKKTTEIVYCKAYIVPENPETSAIIESALEKMVGGPTPTPVQFEKAMEDIRSVFHKKD